MILKTTLINSFKRLEVFFGLFKTPQLCLQKQQGHPRGKDRNTVSKGEEEGRNEGIKRESNLIYIHLYRLHWQSGAMNWYLKKRHDQIGMRKTTDATLEVRVTKRQLYFMWK